MERKLIEQVGEDGVVQGTPVREVYFGPEQVKEEV